MMSFIWGKLVDEFATSADDARTFEIRVFQEVTG